MRSEIFPLEGDNPRIVIDIKKVFSWNGRARIPVNGLLIKQVRTYFHRDQNKLRIVLDLNPCMDYVAVPIYYKADGVYCIEVRAKAENTKDQMETTNNAKNKKTRTAW